MTRDDLIIFALVIFELTILALMKHRSSYLMVMIMYAIMGAVVHYLVQKNGLLHVNAKFNILAIIGSTMMAVFGFKESIKSTQIVGLLVGLISLIILLL
jgi:hypothetical protein